jgi:N utilization substance protein B
MDLGRTTLDYALEHFIDLKTAQAKAGDFAVNLATGAAEALEGTDALIRALSKNWDFGRLSSVDRALLRLGVFELLHRPEIPAEVTLNECIELAKSYGTDESAGFVNGILDQVRREHGAEKNAESGGKARQKAKKKGN